MKNNKNKKYLMTDISFIYNLNGKERIGRNKFYKNKKCTKLSLIIDNNNVPLSIIIKAGNINDSKFLFFIKNI
jgi:hypothetical protein